MKKLREEGFEIVARSAGSHSPIDVWAIKAGEPVYHDGKLCEICDKRGEIKLVQSKGGKSSKRAIAEVEKSGLKSKYEGTYTVTVEVI